jgi:alanine racemase
VTRPTRARVNPEHLRHNARRVRECAPGSKIMACVKADGYGHGIGFVSATLQGLVDGFAVACMDEALALRERGISEPVLLLEGPHSRDEVVEAQRNALTLCISAWHQLEWLEKASSAETPVACWLKIDTGMHRLGFLPDETRIALERLRNCATTRSDVVACTHFASADKPVEDACQGQLEVFDQALCGEHIAQSTANSAAIICEPGSHRDWVRPGYMLYGGSPLENKSPASLDLKPVMELSTEVISLRTLPAGESVGYGGRWQARRESRIATLAVGYGDGYPRHAPDGTPVLIDGMRLPLAGRVSMDMITVDVTDHPGVVVGSTAVLWGSDPGVDEIAGCADTIGYELLAGMPPRVKREVQA